MSGQQPVFIADSCIGGLSVVKALWDADCLNDAVCIADYAINPLGLKSDAAITDVAHRWIELANTSSDTLIIACNTLSIRYHQLFRGDKPASAPGRVVSMVDCFESMAAAEAERLAGRTVLVIGTEYTASQDIYPGILASALPHTVIETAAATELERRIARLLACDIGDNSVLSDDVRRSIDNADVVVLACTCFPMVRSKLEQSFPGTMFLDPGAYCSNLLEKPSRSQDKNLSIRVTGDAVATDAVAEFAESYLRGVGTVSCRRFGFDETVSA